MAVPANRIVIYVDSNNGSDSNTGVIDSPYQTLSKALQEIKSGGLIVLQGGTYSAAAYGDIEKNVSIQAAYGSEPEITDQIRFLNSQGLIQGILFNTGSIRIDNGGFGGISIRNCNFNGPDYPINIVSANYVAIHQNRFYNYLEAIRVSSCREMAISANYFYSDTAINGRSIYVSDVDWLDVYQNTIYGAYDAGGSTVGDLNLRVIYISMNATIINRKAVSLPSFSSVNEYGYDVALNVVNGPTQEYGKDYTVINSGLTVSWDGLGLQGQLQSTDTLRVMYSEGPSPVTGDAISAYNVSNSNSRIDSNSINDASVGVVFTDDVRIRYNNFNGSTSFYSGTTSDAAGNITGPPDYVDPLSGDFHLNPDSPNIDYADIDRWSTILQEMGVGKISGHYTGISLPTGRPGITPFNRNVDYDGLRRLSRPDRDDIGSFEYPSTGINPESLAYIYEDGFDLINPGSITGPFASIDRGFTGLKDLQVEVTPLGNLILNPDGSHVGVTGADAGATGYAYGRYYSKSTDLTALSLFVGKRNRESVAFFYSSFPSNTPTGAYVGPPSANVSGSTGTSENPYRSIDEAISESPSATTIYVKPGIYPSFDGAAGKKLIGIPESNNLSLNGSQYSLLDSSGWTGSPELTLSDSYATFGNPVGLTGYAAPIFNLFGNVCLKANIFSIADSVELKLYDAYAFPNDNFISVIKSGPSLKISHRTGGSTYSVITTTSDDLCKISIKVSGSDVLVSITGDTTNIDRNVSLVAPYGNPWMFRINYEDNASAGSTGVVSKFSSKAELISDVGVTGTSMYRKVFGIIGERGLSGLYSLYGV